VSLDMSLKFNNTSSCISHAIWTQNCQCMFSEMQTCKWVREDVKLPGVAEAQYYIKMCKFEGIFPWKCSYIGFIPCSRKREESQLTLSQLSFFCQF